MKIYKSLIDQQVELSGEHIFSDKKLHADILPKYPKAREQILQFVYAIRRSIKIAAILIVLITTFGLILMYFSSYES